MNNPPVEKKVVCPKCGGESYAIVPKGTKIVKQEEKTDGKVWVNCPSCGNRFIAYYVIG